jgi:hypothetical protein
MSKNCYRDRTCPQRFAERCGRGYDTGDWKVPQPWGEPDAQRLICVHRYGLGRMANWRMAICPDAFRGESRGACGRFPGGPVADRPCARRFRAVHCLCQFACWFCGLGVAPISPTSNLRGLEALGSSERHGSHVSSSDPEGRLRTWTMVSASGR